MELLKVKLLVNEKVVKESLSRVGVGSKKTKTLWPSCYLIERDGEYYLAHFKELFLLKDGGYNNILDEDIERRNATAFCLRQWGLIEVDEEDITPHTAFVFVLPFGQKKEWKISHKINTYDFERGD